MPLTVRSTLSGDGRFPPAGPFASPSGQPADPIGPFCQPSSIACRVSSRSASAAGLSQRSRDMRGNRIATPDL